MLIGRTPERSRRPWRPFGVFALAIALGASPGFVWDIYHWDIPTDHARRLAEDSSETPTNRRAGVYTILVDGSLSIEALHRIGASRGPAAAQADEALKHLHEASRPR